MNSPTRAAIYARISRDASGEGLGVRRQLEDCRKLAASRGWTVAEEYIDNDISAYGKKPRPAYDRMIADLVNGDRDGVIVYNLDRVTRRPAELETFAAILTDAKVSNLAAVTGDLDLGTNDGLLMARFLGAIAANESARKSERLKRKALQTAEAGKPNGTHHRPFGYTKDQTALTESEAAIIREATQRYLAGESLGSLVTWLQDSKVSTVTGADWHTSTLRAVLINPRIAGLRAHLGRVVATAVWPAIITPAQHEQLVATFARKTSANRRTPRRYLLSGMLRCGNCGGKLFSSIRVDIRRYVCMSGPDHGGCGKLSIVASPVEEWIAEAVLTRLDSSAMADALAGRAAADDRTAALSAELEADEAQMRELSELWAARSISTGEWKAAREPIEARIDSTNRQLRQITGGNSLAGLVGNGSQLRSTWATLSLSRQAAIIAAVLDYATVNAATSRGRGFDPFRVVPAWTR